MDEIVEGEEKRRVPEFKLQLEQNLLKVGATNFQENVLHTVSIGVNLRRQREFIKEKHSILVSRTFVILLHCTCNSPP